MRLLLWLGCTAASVDGWVQDSTPADDSVLVDTAELGALTLTVKHDRGLKYAPFTQELSSPYLQGVIRYTLDGRAPSETGIVYDRPLEISATTLLRAGLFDTDGALLVQDTWSFVFRIRWASSSPPMTIHPSGGRPGAVGPIRPTTHWTQR